MSYTEVGHVKYYMNCHVDLYEQAEPYHHQSHKTGQRWP